MTTLAPSTKCVLNLDHRVSLSKKYFIINFIRNFTVNKQLSS